jgi:steroid delta-isomerase-like uncharacterized protein
MRDADHHALVQRYCDAFERGDVAALDDLIDPNVVDNNAYESQQAGIEGYREFFRLWKAAFPDLKVKLEMTVSQGDLVAYRWIGSGTHLGHYHEHPPSGRSVRFSAIAISRIRDGRIVDDWTELDNLGLLKQLGVID